MLLCSCLVSSPQHICLSPSSPLPSLLSILFNHGRVNLLILQAASLSIYLSSCVFFPSCSRSLRGRAVLSGPSRAVGLSRVMDDYQPSAVFHCAPGRFTGSLTTRHENQSLLLILPFHRPRPPRSFHRTSTTSTSPRSPRKAFIMKRWVWNKIEILMWTGEGGQWHLQKGYCECVRVEKGVGSDTSAPWQPYLTHLCLHLIHLFSYTYSIPLVC